LLRMADMSPWVCIFINSVWTKSGQRTGKTVIKLDENHKNTAFLILHYDCDAQVM